MQGFIKTGVIVLAGLFCVSCSQSSSTSLEKEDPPAEWNQIWQAEFTNDGDPDPTKWSFTGRGTPDWKRYCTDSREVVFVKDGKLHLRGIISKNKADTAAYHTGCIMTKNHFAFKYGKIKVKASLPTGKGSWPAIWMMPQKAKYGSWPNSGEIDIMEHLNDDSFIHQVVHTNYIDVQNKNDPPYSTTVSVAPTDFNVYGLVWQPDRLVFYVNGQRTFTYPRIEGAGWKQWPFDQEFYIILDQALGGSWVGSVDKDDLPVEMVVDWVRVYKKSSEMK